MAQSDPIKRRLLYHFQAVLASIIMTFSVEKGICLFSLIVIRCGLALGDHIKQHFKPNIYLC
jgi:urease accessory protein UreH